MTGIYESLRETWEHIVDHYSREPTRGKKELDWGMVGLETVVGSLCAAIIIYVAVGFTGVLHEEKVERKKQEEYPALYSRMATHYDSNNDGLFDVLEQAEAWKAATGTKRAVSEAELKDYFPTPDAYAQIDFMQGITAKSDINERIIRAIAVKNDRTQ